ncbi:MAG: hypothetical protein J5854_07445 [Clostridia bacterium]|nr:hypothetical protein [Clostridia bacterium]
MPTWSIVLIAVAAALILSSGIIHRHVIAAMIKRRPFKAPKWHVWLPKKMRVE